MGRDFQLIPAIDLMDGQCVRLTHGRAELKSVYSDNPAEMARSFELNGAKRLHIVDLDGAFQGKPCNLDTIRAIRERVSLKVQVGGGLRRAEDIEAVFSLGVDYAILGTRAVEDPRFLKSMVDRFGEKIIAAVDAHNGKVAVRGWVDVSDFQVMEWARKIEGLGVRTVIYTDIASDGTLSGPNLEAQRAMAQGVQMSVIASGGIASMEDILALASIPCDNLKGAIAGKALYDGKLNLAEVFEALRSR